MTHFLQQKMAGKVSITDTDMDIDEAITNDFFIGFDDEMSLTDYNIC